MRGETSRFGPIGYCQADNRAQREPPSQLPACRAWHTSSKGVVSTHASLLERWKNLTLRPLARSSGGHEAPCVFPPYSSRGRRFPTSVHPAYVTREICRWMVRIRLENSTVN